MVRRPEATARVTIDQQLIDSGWVVQDAEAANPNASLGVAVREFPLKKGHGFADYLLYIGGKAAGVIEAKKEGETLTGVEIQVAKYRTGLPDGIPRHGDPLPFSYLTTGSETKFANHLDPEPRSRQVFHFHSPRCLSGWLEEAPSTFRRRLGRMPPLSAKGMWDVQARAVRNLEVSLSADKPRALIQMATGSGKTFTAISSVYRLVRHANATRVLFLVDRANLGRQALKEFQAFVTPDDGRKFSELYNVQHLTSNKIDPVAKVVITTVQRLYSMLRGDDELDPTVEEGSQFDGGSGLIRESVPVTYNPAIPVEFFDVMVIDECHRSIYNLWRQVVEYFDAHLIGLTATPSKQTFGFFNQNLVMEYNHAEAVADRVNVDFNVYRIRTQITEAGSKVEAGNYVGKMNRRTRKVRWEQLDEEMRYPSEVLDRDVVAPDQIRTVVRTFRDRLFTEIFPGRKEVPKTLVFAKDDNHAENIVKIMREEFGRGDDFCQKITYKTTGAKPEELLMSFRLSPMPRIAVTVDMVATGTDIRPLEIVMFLRAVKSRTFFEQMKGRGVRIIDPTEFRDVTPDAEKKTHFVIVDCVGACESELSDSQPLERKPSVAFDKLLKAVSFGNTEEEVVSSLASRLARLDRMLDKGGQEAIVKAAGGKTLHQIVEKLVEAVDEVKIEAAARAETRVPEGQDTPPEAMERVAEKMRKEAVRPLVEKPELRSLLEELKRQSEQTIDEVSKDAVLEAGFSEEARARAKTLVESFEKFIAEHKDEITALQVLYSRPYGKRLRYEDVKALAEALQAPPRGWTSEGLWRAYATLRRDRVRGRGAKQMLTDVVSLVRFAVKQDDVLVPFRERVEERFAKWMAEQERAEKRFTAEQREWLVMIKDHIAGSVEMTMEDFDSSPFAERGGAGRAAKVFAEGLSRVLDELNQVLSND